MSDANPRRDGRFEKYRSVLLRYVEPRAMRGLEIGAFDLPFVTPDEGNVEFLDYAPTEELLAHAKVAHGHSPEFVVPVTYVVPDGDWTGVPEGYDWAAAAHVIEHVPSIIDWLRAAGKKLKENGILFLVVPDKRFTFDYFRPETTLGRILEDHFHRKVTPGPAEVFDSNYYTRDLDTEKLWKTRGRIRFDPKPAVGAMEIIRSAAAGYVDVHCSVFTQKSFSMIMDALCGEEIVPFSIEEMGEVDRFELDFHCVLRKIGHPAVRR